MKKNKILHVVTVLNRGGLETMLVNLHKELDRERFQFDYLVQRDNGHYENQVKDLGATIFRLPKLSFSPFQFFEYYKQLKKFFRENSDYDIVHVHTNSFGYFPLKLALRNNIKVRISHSHISSLKDHFLKVFIGNILKRGIKKYANVYFACGIEAGKWMYGSNEKFIVINNAIDAKKFVWDTAISQKIRKELDSVSSKNIVHVGRFNEQKNHVFLLGIFKQVTLKDSNVKLFLLGEGHLEEEIKAKAKELNIIDKVIFLGVREDVNHVLQAMDIFLFPSLFEGLPVSLVEAQASGIKCVISNMVPEESILLKDNVTVISLEKNAEFWAQEILKIDTENRKNVLKEIREKNYDIDDNVKKIQNYYIEYINKFE